MGMPQIAPLVERASILFVDPGVAEQYLPSLRTHYEVSAATSADQAIRALRAFQPELVITELVLPDGGDGLSVCREAKALAMHPPSVLMLTPEPARAPDAIIAGCDGVLLKPFAPNLLYARMGRLLRERAAAVGPVAGGTNVVCDAVSCPSCGRSGAVSFDAAGHGRAWYACTTCRNAWLARFVR